MSIEIPTVEMAKCEGCGEYHPVEECEIVVIRIVKGKGCSLPSNKIKSDPRPAFRSNVDDRDAEHINERPGPVTVFKEEAPAQPVTVIPKKNIIPPAIAAMMLDPGDPRFDQFGAKETRRV